MTRSCFIALAVAAFCRNGMAGNAATVQFFNTGQTATLLEEGVTWDVISSNGYQFRTTRDKLFTGGTGQVIGRQVRVPWPQGVEAQAITVAPFAKPEIIVKRVDGALFDLTAFSAKLLANTGGAGGAFEIMPTLNGEDAWNDPIAFQGSGYYGQTFSYDESTPSYLGNTSLLKQFDAYKISIYVDFAWTALTLVDASAARLGDFDADGDVDGTDFLVWQRGQSPNSLSTADLTDWQANFGTNGQTASVPEPATGTTFFLALSWFVWRRRSPTRP